MNQHLRTPEPVRTRFPPERPTTQAAEGLPRIAWTTADVLAMVAAGILHESDRLELIGGEIVPMSPAGRRHEVVADTLLSIWRRPCPDHAELSVERQFNLDVATHTLPDVVVRPASIKMYDVRGPDVLLVVEVADTSLAYDAGAKALIYSRFGVREYWVINAITLMTRIHRDPTADGYRSRPEFPATDRLVPHLVPELAVRLADLDLA